MSPVLENECRAYFDESCVDPSHPFPVVAGFVATTDMWQGFEKQWAKVVAENPALDDKKYHRIRSEFRPEWSEQARIRHAEVLKATQMRCVYFLRPLYVTFERKLFERMYSFTNVKLKAPLFSSAYAICSFACSVLLDDWAKKNLHDRSWPVKVVFDDGNENKRFLERGYRKYYEDFPETALSKEPQFEDGETVAPLKAADTYAWHLAKYYNSGQESEVLRLFNSEDAAPPIVMNMSGPKWEEHWKKVSEGFLP